MQPEYLDVAIKNVDGFEGVSTALLINQIKMNMNMKKLVFVLLLVACSISGLIATNLQPEVQKIQRWNPHDFSFSASSPTSNPFLVEFSATATGPNGITLSLPGFFDGNNNWKIRFAPTLEGQWSLITKSELKELNGKTISFKCVKNPNKNIHGILRVDAKNPHHFIFEDGSRFFMQAYEYDWLWALDMGKSSIPTVGKTLDLIAKYGFNYIIINSYAYDTNWRKGKTSTDDYGPSEIFPWKGTNDAPDHSVMNLAYWQHYDQVIAALMDRSMQAHIFIKVYNKAVNWPEKGSAEEQLFFRWLMARYSAYPNIIWDFSKEAHNEKNLTYKQEWLKYIRKTDPYHHLVTVHDDDIANDSGAYDGLTDFRADQHHGNGIGTNANHTGSNHGKILFQRERRAWPVANLESDYECGLGGLEDKTYNKAMTPEATAQTLWDIAMAGGYTAYYYTYTAWDVIRPLDEPRGYTYMKYFGDFWRATEYWKLEPSDALVNSGCCMAQPGREYVVFQEKAQPFTLNITGVTSSLMGEWFDPFTGKRSNAGKFKNGSVKLNPPADWGDSPLVLHLSAKR